MCQENKLQTSLSMRTMFEQRETSEQHPKWISHKANDLRFSLVLDELTDVTNTAPSVADINYMFIPEIDVKFAVTKELTSLKSG